MNPDTNKYNSYNPEDDFDPSTKIKKKYNNSFGKVDCGSNCDFWDWLGSWGAMEWIGLFLLITSISLYLYLRISGNDKYVSYALEDMKKWLSDHLSFWGSSPIPTTSLMEYFTSPEALGQLKLN